MWTCDVNERYGVFYCCVVWLVSSFTNNLWSIPKLDDDADGLLPSAPPGDGDKCIGSSPEPLQCYVRLWSMVTRPTCRL